MNTKNMLLIALIACGNIVQGAAQSTNKPCVYSQFESLRAQLRAAIATNSSKAETAKELISLVDKCEASLNAGNGQDAVQFTLMTHEKIVQFFKKQHTVAQKKLATTSDGKEAAHLRTDLAEYEKKLSIYDKDKPSKPIAKVRAWANVCPKEKCPCGSKKQYQKCCGKGLYTKNSQSNAAQAAGAGAAGKQG